MFRKFMLLAGVVGMVSVACAETIIPGGNVSGTWAAAGSPFLIQGEITVPSGQTLNIEPGVQVIFQGHHKLIVNGLLEAIGTEQDSILFTAADTSVGWHGIRFINAQDSSRLDYCIALYGDARGSTISDKEGGGIYIFQTILDVQHCAFRNCKSRHVGGAISISQSTAYIAACEFTENHAIEWIDGGGGAIFAWASYTSIVNCIFKCNNSGAKGGGVYFEHSISILENNIFQSNTAQSGAGITAGTGSDLQIINNTFCNNVARNGGGFQGGSGSTVIANCIFWGNLDQQIAGLTQSVSFCNIQGGWPGTGNINANPLFVPGPAGHYYLSQFAAGQFQQSPCVNSGDSASPIIDGTTRSDGVPDVGIVDMGYHYSALFPPPPPPPIEISLSPFNPPIIIPQYGAQFSFQTAITNNTDSSWILDAWTIIQTPGGQLIPAIGRTAISLAPYFSILRSRDQLIPASAPAGLYTYLGFVGIYRTNIIDIDNFPFTKLGSNRDWLGADGWISSGEPFDIGANGCTPSSASDPDGGPGSATPTMKASPNPFNPTTVASFELRVASHVSLQVYDTAGRLVATLVDGWREAGAHEVTFDGSGLAAGIYFARLEAGSGSGPEGGLRSTTPTTVVQKMVLLK